MTTSHVIAEIINAIASLLWPLITACAIYLFRTEIRDLLRRLSHIKKGKLFGTEIELDEKLDQLTVDTEKAKEITAGPDILSTKGSDEPVKQLEQQLLRDSTKSPRISLIALSEEIDRRMRQLLAASGWHRSFTDTSMSGSVERLLAQGSLPRHVSGSVKLFQEVRNKIIHGSIATDEEVVRAVDAGFTLLKAIELIPLEKNTVYRTGVPLYADAQCTQLINNAHGVILETISPGGAQKSLRIFPTTQTHFEVGKRVAWEWNPRNIWGPAWYKDPGTGECKQAWGSSSEFIGRHLEDV